MIGEVVTSGALWLALAVAFAAGVVAFLSPCVLPLAPGYVSYITGLTGAELADTKGRRGQVLAGSLLFVLGFSVVFVSYGVLFGGAGSLLLEYADVINRVLGVKGGIGDIVEGRPASVGEQAGQKRQRELPGRGPRPSGRKHEGRENVAADGGKIARPRQVERHPEPPRGRAAHRPSPQSAAPAPGRTAQGR
jgi:hypothetical protein